MSPLSIDRAADGSALRAWPAASAAPDTTEAHGSAFQPLLDSLPHPAALLNEGRALVLRNLAWQARPREVACLSLSYGRVIDFADPASETFERVFERAWAGCAATVVIRQRDAARESLWRAMLCRVRHAEAGAAAGVLMLLQPPAAPDTSLVALRRLYDLTAAEARVLALLLEDRLPREIAASLGVSITTVRTHLQALFSKTGTRRQCELVRLAWSAG